MAEKKIMETDLYGPVKSLFQEMGYEVFGEVKDVDVVALKDDHKVFIELKTSFNLKLVLQAVKRQKLCDDVYVAIPMPEFKKRYGKDFKEKEYLLKRLGLGLILVTVNSKRRFAQLVFEPGAFDMKRSRASRSVKRKKNQLERELTGRSVDYNTGGTRGRIITAYREQAVEIVSYLKEEESMSTGDIRNLTENQNATKILYGNPYGWFERVGYGRYKVTDKGREEFEDYSFILEKKNDD